MLPPKVDPKLAAVALFTKRQMAAMLQISIRTLNDMMQRGEVSYLKINGRLVRFRLEDVNRRLTRRCWCATPLRNPRIYLPPRWRRFKSVSENSHNNKQRRKENGNGNDQGNQ